jgi:hypothetical protein
MPDFIDNRANEGAPMGWGDAFAALPQETPPGDGWARIASKLDARAARPGTARRERRTSWLIGLASAAVLVVTAWSPLSQWLQADGSEVRPTAAATAAGLRGPAAPAHAGQQAAAYPIEQTGIAATNAQPQVRPSAKLPSQAERKARARRAHLASTAHRPIPSPVLQPDLAPATAASATTDALHKLKAQSAQLEALVAMARDDNVGNAGNELLSSELDAGIAVVDDALSQQDLADDRRQELWQQRVDLLRQLAGVEATTRWLAAQGASNDTLLVSVD